MKKIPNEQTAAICGLFCGNCPSYPEHCHGCLSDEHTSDCTTCSNGFRDCAKAHNVVRCHECNEFPCDRIKNFSTKHIENGICHHKDVITDLTLMKTLGTKIWLAEKIKQNTCPKCGKIINWMDKNTHKC